MINFFCQIYFCNCYRILQKQKLSAKLSNSSNSIKSLMKMSAAIHFAVITQNNITALHHTYTHLRYLLYINSKSPPRMSAHSGVNVKRMTWQSVSITVLHAFEYVTLWYLLSANLYSLLAYHWFYGCQWYLPAHSHRLSVHFYVDKRNNHLICCHWKWFCIDKMCWMSQVVTRNSGFDCFFFVLLRAFQWEKMKKIICKSFIALLLSFGKIFWMIRFIEIQKELDSKEQINLSLSRWPRTIKEYVVKFTDQVYRACGRG